MRADVTGSSADMEAHGTRFLGSPGILTWLSSRLRGHRTVKRPPTVVVKLREHCVRQVVERLRADRWQGEWELVFTTSLGAPLNGRVVLTAFQRILRRAALPKVRFHDLPPP